MNTRCKRHGKKGGGGREGGGCFSDPKPMRAGESLEGEAGWNAMQSGLCIVLKMHPSGARAPLCFEKKVGDQFENLDKAGEFDELGGRPPKGDMLSLSKRFDRGTGECAAVIPQERASAQ